MRTNKQKNIHLVTWYTSTNFGTELQAFALYKKIEQLGHCVSIFIPVSKNTSILQLCKRFVKKILCVFDNLQVKKRKKFEKENFTIKKQSKRLVIKTDCFITGSDQIWNTYHWYSPFYFLDFAEDKKRVAYASSIGTNNVNEEYKEVVKQHLLKFDHISVRENVAVKALSKLTDRNDIVQVLDPTFLLTPKNWLEMSKYAEFENEIPQTYILCYFVGVNSWYIEQLVNVKNKMNLHKIIVIPLTEGLIYPFEDVIIYKYAGPREFVYLIQHATLVCTDSFHATALSINHSVPFVEFMRFKDDDSKSQNSRIYDLLEHYGLMDRIYDENNMSWTNDINYDRVQEILSADRKFSIDYLVNAIEN